MTHSAASGRTPPLPAARGTLTPDRPLGNLTWLRVGGNADWLFQPADEEDLSAFLAALAPEIPVFPIGVGSNLIVRDGGIRGVVVRLGRAFFGVTVTDDLVHAGAGMLDAHVARKAAEAGRDLTFLRTIPGTIGGAVRMNAGCYGHYVADFLVGARIVTRSGEVRDVDARELAFAYRHSALAPDDIVLSATFRAPPGDPETLTARMKEQLARRDASQPSRSRTAGSTFRNPLGRSSTGAPDDPDDLKAWKLIDDAGMRGARVGGAQMSPLHANFMINVENATAEDFETLGESVQRKVFQSAGIRLEWEIMRVGERSGPENAGEQATPATGDGRAG